MYQYIQFEYRRTGFVCVRIIDLLLLVNKILYTFMTIVYSHFTLLKGSI